MIESGSSSRNVCIAQQRESGSLGMHIIQCPIVKSSVKGICYGLRSVHFLFLFPLHLSAHPSHMI